MPIYPSDFCGEVKQPLPPLVHTLYMSGGVVIDLRLGSATKPGIEIHKECVRIGCASVTIEVLKHILKKYEIQFKDKIVLQ